MLTAIAFTAAVSLGGAALTYLFAKDEGLLWRLCAGNVIGSVLFFFPAYLLGSFLCLNSAAPWILVVSLLLVSLPLLLLRRKGISAEFRHERDLAKGKVQGATFNKLVRFSYYAFFAVLFVVFFGRAMIVAGDGIYTGSTQNLGDLPFHLGAIFSFSEGCNFPPQNPSFAGATFSYPFTADFLTAVLVAVGAEVASAMWVQNVVWAFALLVILERFVLKVTGDRLAGKFAAPILFFSGGFGFFWFIGDYWAGSQGLWDSLWNLGKDYTIGDEFRWGSSLVTLFITQRSLLLGMPLALIVAGFLWKKLAADDADGAEKGKAAGEKIHALFPAFLVGLLAGTLPLVHAHSLFVLFVVSGCWFFFSLERWKEWAAFGIGTAIVAVPELYWVLSGSASRTGEFFAWHFGYQAGDQNVVWFWLKNTGLFIPMLLAAFALLLAGSRNGKKGADPETEGSKRGGSQKGEASIRDAFFDLPNGRATDTIHVLAVFYLPFLLLFLVSNLFKLAPWEWDNIKVLIYWFAGSIPLVALVLSGFWKKGSAWKAMTAVCFAVLVFSGALDVWRTASGQIRNQVFDIRAIDLAEWMRFYTEPDAVILNAPTYNSAAVLSGRISVMRYPGHLSSHGIDYQGREDEVKRIYAGAPDADSLLRKYNVRHILVSPREREAFPVNDGYLSTFEYSHEVGDYKLYRVHRGESVR
ncbi:MAG: hypothetical protein J5I65_02915 [Aridibacter famidurans]|nr:hypothetical protein [Aridibacter famidurans]